MSISSWFSDYVKDNINISKNKNSEGKRSRDWLIEQISKLSNRSGFPSLYPNEYDVKMGSYARKTQIKPLDDIDQMIVFNACGSTANFDSSNWNDIKINVPENATNLIKFVGENGLSSIKLMNRLKEYLKSINQYRNAEIKRNNQVIRLDLNSYEWGFDIIPGFRTVYDSKGNYYYIMPNGKGTW
ncbi:hypothetical protein M8332_06650 [Fructilactobacillus ixorae]|uniref:Nucleotidyltransferase n=1 Tax=Fructilactobacillus ixorae TaxID=1750535 RepID=A0ABY5C3D0_9LACO|nr:hypothetical protein [Fructilactobacillus ixorae]USS93264.1 hypothetical protein M8332_06650 [Fructilactobacillus ixorae]